jgi:Pyruvate/2-oxoacid:ferredoxin oxidoreductase delta subunit
LIGMNQFKKVLLALQTPALSVHPEYCSRLRHRSSRCSRCSDNCPAKAIEWSEGFLSVDADKCTNCGICANACPNGVFESLKPGNLELLNKIKLSLYEKQEIVFKCNPDGGDKKSNSILVPCLARLDEGILVACIAMGAEVVRLTVGNCKDCKNKNGLRIARQTVSNANGLFEFFGSHKRIFFNKCIDSMLEPQTISRREFFTNLAQETKTVTALFVNNVGESGIEDKLKRQGPLPTCLPMKRKILLDSMRKLGSTTEKLIESPLFCLFKVDDNCTDCQMCAFFCPTGAIEKVNKEGKSEICFKISNCVACGLCKDICYRKAVSLYRPVEIHNIMNGYIERVINPRSSKRLQESSGNDFIHSIIQQ